MDYKDIQNDATAEALIKLETLQKEYEVVLQQYQESVQNYIAVLQSGSTSTDSSKTFTALKGRTWWGTQGLTEGQADSQEECESMCANAENCSGATFNPVKRYCWARGGNSSLTPGVDDDYALIPQQKASLIAMKGLNDRLTSLADQIMNTMATVQPAVNQQKEEKNMKQEQLDASYQRLLEQKLVMEKQLQEYNSIEEDYENQDLYATQENVSYRFWTLLAAIILIVTIKKMYGLESMPINAIFWLALLILLIIFSFSLSQPSGFIMWGFLLMIIALMNFGILPSL
jgi:hypothetical protein